MVCVPALRVEVLRVATPEPLRAPLPMALFPSKNETIPVGFPIELVTVAVKVMLAPKLDGLALEESSVKLGSLHPHTGRIQQTPTNAQAEARRFFIAPSFQDLRLKSC